MTTPVFRLRSKIMIPIGMGFLFFCLAGMLFIFLFQQNLASQLTASRIRSASRLFNQFLDSEAENIEIQSRYYLQDPALAKLFLAGNREGLYQETLPEFHRIRTRYNITHFYFHRPDGTCFLRVHDVGRYDDRINRFTMDEARKTSAPSHGIELGPLGTFTLRVVSPWLVGNTLIGYIELGKEIDHLAPKLHDTLGLDIIFAIEKKFLDRKLWEEGKRVMDESGHWDRYPNHIIASSTMPSAPGSLAAILGQRQNDHCETIFELPGPDRTLRAGCLELRDAGGTKVGEMIIASDFTSFSSNERIFLGILLAALLLTGMYCFALYLYFGRQERLIKEYQEKLIDEINNHKETGQELIRHRDQLDQLVRERTHELEKALAEVKILSGILPICASCKRIRNKEGKWEQIESYISNRSEMVFSHGYCPVCAQKLYDEISKDE